MMYKQPKNGLNEEIRIQMEHLIEKCVIIGILCKNEDGLAEKHREKMAIKLIREAYGHLVGCEEALYHYNQSTIAIDLGKEANEDEAIIW